MLKFLGLFSLSNAAGCVFFLSLLFLFILGDTLLDVAFQIAAQMNWQLGQFKGHLIALIPLRVLLNDLDDAFRLLGRQTIDLSNQVVALLHRQWFLLEAWRGLGLSRGSFNNGTVRLLIVGLRCITGLAGVCWLLRLSSCWFLCVLFLKQAHLLLQFFDLKFLPLQLSSHLGIIGIQRRGPADLADLTEDRFILQLGLVNQIIG